MSPKPKICVVTGTRADYGPLVPAMRAIQADPDLQLQVAVTGMHLSEAFGLTYKAIEADGFTIDAKVKILQDGDDSAPAVARAVGRGFQGFADAFTQLKPDFVMVLGDRFELLAAAGTALILRIPIVHLCGGDVTEGAFDEAIRHAITKMAAVHFVSNEESAKRVRQLGENPAHVHVTGNPALDDVADFTPMERAELEAFLDFKLRETNLLVTFHPVTLEKRSSLELLDELLDALARLDPASFGVIITLPNADTEGLSLIKRIEQFADEHENVCARSSLGQRGYYSAIAHCDAVVGNSSSGLYEAPSFKTPTVNIGDREKGRIRASSVIDVAGGAEAIYGAIQKALTLDCSGALNPYGDGHASARIVTALKGLDPADPALIKKAFFDLD